ncbi:MAG: hypothetical protein SGJ19_03580 [Planctomycetia bacterium]|nr:hypothetical protein [Planctomycetia bacterium]
MRFNFSIKSLMLLSAVIAVALGTLSGQSPWWSTVQDSIVWGTLLYAVIAAWAARGAKQQFARGYAVAGILYFLMAFDHSYRSLPGPQHATDQVARRVYEVVENLRFRGWIDGGPTDQEIQQILLRRQAGQPTTWGQCLIGPNARRTA